MPDFPQMGHQSCLVVVVFLSGLTTFGSFSPVGADEYRTPLAGDEFHTELFGNPVDVAKRDRTHVTAANFGVQWLPDGPPLYQALPFGALYVWRNMDEGHQRFRGTFSGVVNDVYYHIGPSSLKGWELAFTFANTIIPLSRAEYVEGQRIQAVQVAWSYFFAGAGIGYRHLISPWHQDNAVEIALTYEPGYRWFDRSTSASPNFIVPSDTYEGRIRLRLRVDALDRNLMELPHRGFAFGGDLVSAHRTHWAPWGGVAFPTPNVQKERN